MIASPQPSSHNQLKSLNSFSVSLLVTNGCSSFVKHRVGNPRMISLVRRWLKAGILEDGEIYPNEEGTPQGGSISVMLSNVYLHYVLDLWFERVVKPRLRGEAHIRVRDALQRLGLAWA